MRILLALLLVACATPTDSEDTDTDVADTDTDTDSDTDADSDTDTDTDADTDADSDTDTDTDTDSDTDADTDADADPWPTLTAATTWQWQLTGTVNTSYDVDVYDIDLFDVPDATLATLRADGRTVVCYFSAGSREDWRPDADRFPDAVLGRDLDGWEGERWLDVRDGRVLAIMEGRLDLAAERGCDLVEPDNVDGYQNRTGFPLTGSDQLDYLKALSDAAHARGLGILLKNSADLVATAEPWFEGAVVEQCAEYAECDAWLPFLVADKAVLQAEYTEADTLRAAERLAEGICPDARDAGRHALVLPWDLDDAFRVTCDP